MKIKTQLILLAIGTLSLAACGNNNPDDATEMAHEENKEKMKEDQLDDDLKKDIKFAETAADDGLFEVQAAELAKTNASSQQIKDFAAQMAKDHGAANEELKKLAASKNITIPESMSEDKQVQYGKLADKTGKDFDEAYTDAMVKAHKNAVNLFEKEAEDGKDIELRDWAAQKLPVLRHHLQMAEELENMADGKTSTRMGTMNDK